MRGADTFTESLFTMRHLDDFVPADHPLRVIRVMVNKALANMDGLFAQMYAADIKGGRPSIAPEKLLRAMLIQVLYSMRSERQLMEQTQYNLLFRWFIGLAITAEQQGTQAAFVQQLATTAHHAQQATTTMVVLGVCLEMRGQFVDASGQQGHLHFWATGVVGSTGVRLDDFGLDGGCDHVFSLNVACRKRKAMVFTCASSWNGRRRASCTMQNLRIITRGPEFTSGRSLGTRPGRCHPI